MIKYHGTPVGGSKLDAIKFLKGRHALISFAYPGQTAEVLECCESFCLDNGAFTIWKASGGRIDVPAYEKFVNELATHPSFDFCLIPDVIMGSDEENDKLIAEWESEFPSIPVYHLGEPIDRFFRLASKFSKVAFGSTSLWPRNGSKEWWVYMADFMDTVTDSRGVLPCKVHGLRMLDVKLFQYLPLHSGDSTNAGVNGHLCMKKGIHPAVERWQGNERIAQKIEAFQSAPVWDREWLIEEGVIEK
jgi:hypothetical protein